jgi:hypothetical protein
MNIAFGEEALIQENDTRNPFLTQQEQSQGFIERISYISESKGEVNEKLFLLQAIFVRGENFTALINGQVMHEGSEMEGFVVESIDKNTVLLMNSKGKEIILKLTFSQKSDIYEKS